MVGILYSAGQQPAWSNAGDTCKLPTVIGGVVDWTAAGTAGQIPYVDATPSIAWLPSDTAGKVMTLAGTPPLPSWQSPSSNFQSVQVSATGGSNGSATARCNLTYTVKDFSGTTTIATGVIPQCVRPTKGYILVPSYGIWDSVNSLLYVVEVADAEAL